MQEDKHLQRGLGTGPMVMLAVGSTIGTGLFLGSGAAIGVAGPAIGLSYVLAAAITYVVTMALGELAAKHPEAASYGVAAETYLGPWAGFVSRYGYWFAVLLSVGAEMVASATYMHFWFPMVPGTVWMVLFGCFVTGINMAPVRGMGRFEFGFTLIKVITIFVFIAWLEEFFFRGIFQNLLARTLGSRRRAQAFASVAFGISHILLAPAPNWRYAIVASIAGWFYGCVFVETGTLMAPAMLHALVDTVWRTWFGRGGPA